MTHDPQGTTPAPASEPLWTKAHVDQWLSERAALGDTRLALVLASDIVYDYEAKLAQLEQRIRELSGEYQAVYLYYIELAEKNEARIAELERQLAAETSKFETAKECAEIISRQLEEARASLREHGIYDDEGEDTDDDAHK